MFKGRANDFEVPLFRRLQIWISHCLNMSQNRLIDILETDLNQSINSALSIAHLLCSWFQMKDSLNL